MILAASDAASVTGSDRLRLFCAFRLPAGAVGELAAWQAASLAGGRLVAPDDLHVTLAFLGARPPGDLPRVAEALREAAAGSARPRFGVRGYRETRSVGMLTLEDEDGRGAAIAGRLQALLEERGLYRAEARPWLAQSPSCASASGRISARPRRRLRTYVRPTPLFSFLGCRRGALSTPFSNRLH